ncbi:MAG: integrase core domain-containing protein [Planctomycetota bacterium]
MWVMLLWQAVFGVVETMATRRDARIRLLQAQIEMLQARVPGNRVILARAERSRLLRIGGELGHQLDDLLSIVAVKTYRRWLREAAAGREVRRVGRRRIVTVQLQGLIRRLARENPGWGARRIVGELKKLGIRLSRSTTRRVLIDEGGMPDPSRHAPKGIATPWRTFVDAQANVIVATDFFCKTVWTATGYKTAYVLVFIHLKTRRVMLSPATFNPNGEWMLQQARNLLMWLEDEGLDCLHLIHDNDTKFTSAFGDLLRQAGVAPLATPIAAPIANCYAESWIGGFKRECLNHLLIFKLRQLDYVTAEYTRYFNELRPHQGLENTPPCSVGRAPPRKAGVIARERVLGGLLNHYYRRAA